MKSMARLLAVLSASLVVTALLVSCGGSITGNRAPTTTVLVYMEGTNLEVDDSAAKKNITEMLAAPNSPYLNVVLSTGAADKAVAGDAVSNWRVVRRYAVSNHQLVIQGDLGVLDMGTPKALTDFISWGQTYYPADRYVLVFWDHGGGPLGGFGGNDVAATNASYASSMNIAQLQQGVNNAVQGRPDRQFQLIGFDACLMAAVEVADAFKALGHYLAASQEIEPGAGWDWTVFLTFLALNPSADGASIGAAIADGYKAKMIKGQQDAIITFSITDLTKIQRIDTALSTFARDYQALLGSSSGGSSAWNNLALSRSRAVDFTHTTEVVDIVSMFGSQQLLEGVPAIAADVTELTNATQDAVIKTVSGPYRTLASGLSVMFPTFSVWTPDVQLAAYAKLDYFSPDYRALLTGYSTYAVNTVPDLAFGTVALDQTTMTTMTGNINPANSNYEQVYVAINDSTTTPETYRGLQPIYSTSADASVFKYSSTDKWFMLNGKLASVLAEPTTEKGVQTLKIPMHIDRPAAKDGTTRAEVLDGMYYVLYDFNSDVLVQAIGFVGDAHNQVDPAEPLVAGDLVSLLSYYLPDAKNPIGGWAQVATDELQFTVGATQPTFAKAAIPAGRDYAFFGFDLRMKPFVSTSVKLE